MSKICLRSPRVLEGSWAFSGECLGFTMRVEFGDCVFDAETRELTRGGEQRHLSPKVFSLLEVLIRNRPRVLSKAELHDTVWQGTFVSDATLASAIAEIREALGDVGRKARYIRTVHGYGYAFRGAAQTAGSGTALGTGSSLIFQSQEVKLPVGETVLGRGPDVGILLQDDSVSRRHARVLVDGEARVEDLGSKNGTFVNGVRVRDPRQLTDGDQIQIGDVTATFHRVMPDASTRTAQAGRTRRT
jgi:DNA-binding winged helix-turn-helix (wHTH) protein